MTGRLANVTLNLLDQGIHTRVVIDPALGVYGSAPIYGSATPQIMTNKTLTDSSNVIAASSLRAGANLLALPDVLPEVGQVLTVSGPSTLAWTEASTPVLVSNTLYVDVNGSDLTGTGSIAQPYQTIQYAMNAITTNLPSNRFAIMVGPGTFNASSTISLKPNVQIMGVSNSITRISGNIVLDASWLNVSGSNDNRSGFINLSLVGTSPLVFDYASVQSGAGKLYFYGVSANGVLTFNAFRSINQNRFTSCLLFSDYNNSGCNDIFIGGTYVIGNCNLTSNADCRTQADFQGGVIGGALNVVYSLGNPYFVAASAENCNVQGAVSVSGASASLSATSCSLSSVPVLTSGGTLTLTSAADVVKYVPANPAAWSVVPTTIQAALDLIAANLGVV